MKTSSGIFYQLRLSLRLGRKTIGLGSHRIHALSIAMAVDEEITRQIKAGDEIDIDTLKSLVREQLEALKDKKQGIIRVVEKDDLRVLWDKYVDWHTKMGTWSQTTILTRNATVTAIIDRCPYQRLEQKREIVNWLLEDGDRTIKTSKERFKTIVACVDWCSKQDIIPRRWGIEYRDLLATMTIKGHVADNVDADGNVDIFKVAEVYRIIEALRSEEYARFKNTHCQYWRYVAFLWLTGCRPSEAVALKWGNVDLVKRQVNFKEGQVNASGTIVKKSGTKTVQSRIFPINEELQLLIESLPGSRRPNEYVFLNKKGNAISQQALNTVWRKLLDDMNIRYRVPYQLRHTMISYHANNDFPLHKLAVLVGNSEEVIREHYLKLDIERISLPGIIK
ncbi:MAG TPA: tyrosine-type recombinase/integrase [Nostoc sp.]|uniref:tyrosine-type recombinase/integrase n=1 Tax=Nostoc sp. TaxID=1180 RepID=UPI002D4483F6|nr:tyrosine-type recombinase/integrase [Nostoc sp.]HYX16489.1 tyrosine-type recombinase/integrase [Nostoc sp.]